MSGRADTVLHYVEAYEPRQVLVRLSQRPPDAAQVEIDLLVRDGGWVRGTLARIDARSSAAVLVGSDGDAVFVLLDDVRAVRLPDAMASLEVLSGGRYEPVEAAALSVIDARASLDTDAGALLTQFGIELEVDLDGADHARARQSLLTAARTLCAVLLDLGESREGAGQVARALDVVEVRAGIRPDVRRDERRLVYWVDPTEGPQGRLRPDRLRRNVESVLPE